MSWHIVNQHQTVNLTAAGNFEDVMEVTAVSDSTGTAVTVRIPKQQYTVERVKKELDKQFDTVHEVHQLTGD